MSMPSGYERGVIRGPGVLVEGRVLLAIAKLEAGMFGPFVFGSVVVICLLMAVFITRSD